MTPEQKQRIEQINAAQVKRRESLAFHQSEYPGLPSPDYINDIDFLLSLVKSQWQPIETAPKDGTMIIGALIGDGRVWRVCSMTFKIIGWYESYTGVPTPIMTHWIPLPDPPQQNPPTNSP